MTSLAEARCQPFRREFVEMEMLENDLMLDGQELIVVENIDDTISVAQSRNASPCLRYSR